LSTHFVHPCGQTRHANSITSISRPTRFSMICAAYSRSCEGESTAGLESRSDKAKQVEFQKSEIRTRITSSRNFGSLKEPLQMAATALTACLTLLLLLCSVRLSSYGHIVYFSKPFTDWQVIFSTCCRREVFPKRLQVTGVIRLVSPAFALVSNPTQAAVFRRQTQNSKRVTVCASGWGRFLED
jgi:hypothetical protein